MTRAVVLMGVVLKAVDWLLPLFCNAGADDGNGD